MKQIIFTLAIFMLLQSLSNTQSEAQIAKPVKWSYTAEQNQNEATLVIKSTIDKPWHLYSQHIADGGPIPTSFAFTPSDNYELIGNTSEPDAATFHDPNFDMDLKTFEDQVIFKQKIKVKTTDSFSVKGVLEFMVCNDKMCLPPEKVPFEIKVNSEKK